MKLYKLMVHNKTFSADDLLVNPKDFPLFKKGDIVEIYHQEDEFSRLLLPVTFKEDLQGREAISVEQSIASTFQLRTYNDVYVNIVNPEAVALDSVELTFKDQYLGRSEMWRLKNSLVNTCVYLNKKIEFCGGTVRCQVYEMWAMGDRVACGVINEDTKVVFRSSTSMVYLFLQMSSEMWDFDIHGDLYFEKAVNGFMADLFQKWKKFGSNHEVTLVVFSRVFYQAHTYEEFPEYMRDCLQQDYKGRIYEDFYRVIVQNERYDDWSPTVMQLRKLFTDYQQSVLEYHCRPDYDIPKATFSTAAQGNFLEVLNMALNVFEKHYLERSFDRTGQLAVVITPGVGVFEVDRELTNVTKQRIIDNGVGCDLVCVGEQPLHAVPLFKFHNKDICSFAEDYSMPHWINLSFYSSNKTVAYSTFIPRIKLPPRKPKPVHAQNIVRPRFLFFDDEDRKPVTDYDAYDAQVFTLPSATTKKNRLSRLSKKPGSSVYEGSASKMTKRKMSDPDIHHSLVDSATSPPSGSTSAAISIPQRSEDDSALHSSVSANILTSESMRNRPAEALFESENIPPRAVVGSMGSPGTQQQLMGSHSVSGPAPAIRPGRSLINPFDPSHVTIKLTSNRRRWSHIFPKGPNGQLIQQHHYQAAPNNDQQIKSGVSASGSSPTNEHPPSINKLTRSPSQAGFPDSVGRGRSRPNILSFPGAQSRKSMTFLWGATGEQEWTPALTTGVDWKSLTIPACLPITTDYFPDEVCLRTDYVFSDYNLLPDDVNADFAQQRAIYRNPLTTQQVFQELVSQRLAQGFQLIVEGVGSQTPGGVAPGSALVGPRPQDLQPAIEYKLSIGRVFHRIVLSGSEIRVTRYRPRHPYPPFNIHYHYRFQAPDHETYEVSYVSFNTEKLENYNWNYLDHYICTRGDTDFALAETLKYWRFRMYILPLNAITTRKLLEGSERCDIYSAPTVEYQIQLSEAYQRFVETWINKIRRPGTQKKHRTSVASNSPFRERLGSNRLPDKPRPRSGSKVMERGRASPAADVIMPLLSSVASDSDHTESVDETVFQTETLLLKESATHQEIVDAMKHPAHGLGFLSPHASLPGHAFVSADAVSWLKTHMENEPDQECAVHILEDMRKEHFICHASGDFSHPFIVGFYLYHIVNQDKDNKDEARPLGDLQSFENEWLEVEVKPPQPQLPLPTFLCDTVLPTCSEWTGPMYKHTHLEIDVQGKSDRVEWGHVKYQSVYSPDRAYEIVVEWMAASGTIVSELVTGWARKAQASSGLLMIPIPADPFALPFSIKSDPLRGPVFIPLDVECLMGTNSYLFEEFPEETRAQRLVLFQEDIAIRFGFIACVQETGNQHQHNQYIHLTGNVFLMIPTLPCDKKVSKIRDASVSRSRNIRRYPTYNEVVGTSPHQEYITRHMNIQKKGCDNRIGFLWSWNHMISRRWKWCSSAKSDEAFQNKLLSDFRQFCANSDNRLKTFWDASWTQRK